MRSLIFASLIVATACSSVANAPNGTASPTSSAGSPASPSSTASPSGTPRANTTVGPGTYTSVPLAYRVDIPAGWRRSDCQSTRGLTQPPGTETFTSASVDVESGSDTGPAQDVVVVHVEPAAGLTPLQWLESGRLGFSTATRFEATTFDGHDAARIVPVATASPPALIAQALVVGARGLIYAVSPGLRQPAPASEQAASALLASFHVLTDAELATARATLPSPSPAPVRSADDVAAALARGFAQKDTSILAAVADACLTHGAEQAGASFRATTVVLANMQTSFANGFVATVQPALVDATADNASVLGTWQDPGQPRKNVRHMLTRVGSTWYWTGWIDLMPR